MGLLEVIFGLLLISSALGIWVKYQINIQSSFRNSRNWEAANLIGNEIIERIRLHYLYGGSRYNDGRGDESAHARYAQDSIWQSKITPVKNCNNQECSKGALAAWDGFEIMKLAEKELPNPIIKLSQCGKLLCLVISWQSQSSAGRITGGGSAIANAKSCQIQGNSSCLQLKFF